MIDYPRALACGDSGVSIEFGHIIDEVINARVLALDHALSATLPEGVIELVPTYRSLMIHYDPVVASFDTISAHALVLARDTSLRMSSGRRLTIPVCYEGPFGADLPEVASCVGLNPSEFVARHAAADYRVYMLGFQPGFAYLGGLDNALSLPRRPQARFGAPAGTISIAAGQCAVHSIDGPSGWHWIGRTPVETYTAGDHPHFAIEPGDHVRFRPITIPQWHVLKAAAAQGDAIIEVEQTCQH
jgi:KipI family sensor histidine kinase inhibitor